MSMMTLQKQREEIADMPIKDYMWYFHLGKFGIRDMVSWMHNEGGYIGNDESLTQVCSVLYSHWHFPDRPKRNLLLIGDTGSGKTALIETIRRFMRYAVPSAPETFQNGFLRYISATALTVPGYHGLHLVDALGMSERRIDNKGCIVFIDEADKVCQPRWAAGNGSSWSTSEATQQSLLTLLDHARFTETDASNHTVTIPGDKITVILMGCFDWIRKKKTSEKLKKPIGFGSSATATTDNTADTTIQIQDLISSGMLREIAGRLSICHLSKPDLNLMVGVGRNMVAELERSTDYRINISDEKLQSLAVEADHSGLGGRYIRNEIQRLFDRQLLDHYDSDTLTL